MASKRRCGVCSSACINAAGISWSKYSLEREPENFMALSIKAHSHLVEAGCGYRAIAPEDVTAATRAARQAVGLNEASDFAHAVMSGVLRVCELDFDAAEREARRSLELNPYYSVALTMLGDALVHGGSVDDGIEQSE